jgi:hypothetical protein
MMACITVPVENKFKSRMDSFSWVNWSEITRQEIARKYIILEQLGEIEKIASKSKFTDEDADEIAQRIKKSLHEDLKHKELI